MGKQFRGNNLKNKDYLRDRVLMIASSNHGKIREFRELLSALPVEVQSPLNAFDVNESGKTFLENARLKALAVSAQTDQWTLADDSGLCVNSLQGAPGIFSARYAKTDKQRVKRLLNELELCEDRTAHFTAALCIAYKNKILLEVEGRCEGLITKSPRGENGFGYDPVFEVLGTRLTFAEMAIEEKKVLGHRGVAFRLLLPGLRKLLDLAD